MDQQILVVETAERRLYLPGGGLQPGETEPACLAREFREETGHAVRILRRLGEAAQVVHARSEPHGYLKLCKFFLVDVSPPGGAIETDDRPRWLDLYGARERLFTRQLSAGR